MNNFFLKSIIYSKAFVNRQTYKVTSCAFFFSRISDFHSHENYIFIFFNIPKDIHTNIKVIAVITKLLMMGIILVILRVNTATVKSLCSPHSIICYFHLSSFIPSIWFSDLFLCFVFDGFHLTLFDYLFCWFLS